MQGSRGLRLSRALVLAGVMAAAIAFMAGPLAASCQKCDGGGLFLPEIYWPVNQGEAGHKICTDTDGCHVSGDSCTGSYSGGNGGPGGGGGGGDTCSGTGFCPAECFSCDPFAY